MPPLKTFEFICLSDSRITLIIKAYDKTDAVVKLFDTVKFPKDFKLK